MKTVTNFWETKVKTGPVHRHLVSEVIVVRFVSPVRLGHISTTMELHHVLHAKTNLKTHFIIKLQYNKQSVLTNAIMILKLQIQIHYV